MSAKEAQFSHLSCQRGRFAPLTLVSYANDYISFTGAKPLRLLQ